MDFQKASYFLVTGASRGIGKCIAIEISKKLKSGSVVVLLARSENDLQVTKAEILEFNPSIEVQIFPTDLGTAASDNYNKIINDSLKNHNINDFESAFIVHNVGSVGDVTKTAKEVDNMDEWSSYYNLNVFSVIALNSQFIKIFNAQKKVVVNITSKCGVVPFKSMAFYCSGKAAREMYFRVLAEEEPDIKVLNYSPGPVDTEMSMEIQNSSVDGDLKDFFKGQREQKEILTPIQTTTKLIEVLIENKFTSGDHVDYFDRKY